MIKLVVRLGDRTLDTKSFPEQDIAIGRDPQSQLHLDNPSISRTHCVIAYKAGKAVVRDNNSANGIHINGQKVAEKELATGDVISLGKFKILVGFAAAPSEKKTAVMDYGGQTLALEGSALDALRQAPAAPAQESAMFQRQEPKAQASTSQGAPSVHTPPSSGSFPRPSASPSMSGIRREPTVQAAAPASALTPVVIAAFLVGVVLGFIAGVFVAQKLHPTTPIEATE